MMAAAEIRRVFILLLNVGTLLGYENPANVKSVPLGTVPFVLILFEGPAVDVECYAGVE